MSERLQPILTLLDQGLILYRRHLLSFILITAVGVVPSAVLFGLAVATAAAFDELLGVLAVFLVALLMLPVAVYIVGALSRAAVAAADGQPIVLRQALAIGPVRLAGMGCFSLVFLLIAQLVSTVFSLLIICPLYLGGIVLAGSMASVVDASSSGVGAIILVVLSILLIGVYGLALIIGGATYGGLIYGLQPWVQTRLSFGDSLQQSLNLIGYRFWSNLAAWSLAALVIAAVGVSITLTIGVLLLLPLLLLLGDESPVTQAIAATSWILGALVVLPPLPIWMALLYRRNAAARQGNELAARIASWLGQHPAAE